jgi:hypothetical protein
MPDDDSLLNDAIRKIASLLAAAYLRLRNPKSQPNCLDSSGTASRHVTGRLTA